VERDEVCSVVRCVPLDARRVVDRNAVNGRVVDAEIPNDRSRCWIEYVVLIFFHFQSESVSQSVRVNKSYNQSSIAVSAKQLVFKSARICCRVLRCDFMSSEQQRV
jgi:hypothetical protein